MCVRAQKTDAVRNALLHRFLILLSPLKNENRVRTAYILYFNVIVSVCLFG